MDLATLAIEITSTGAGRAEADLRRIENQAQKTGRAANALGKMVGNLKMLLSVGLGIQGISSLIQMADKMTTLNTQVKMVTQSIEQYNQVKQELFEISQRTRGSLEATTLLYTRSSRALENLGLSQKQVLGFTETLNKAMAVGGVGAQEQASALTQLSQALGSGKLQGDEFKSIAETAPIILDVISTYMGKSRAEIKQLGTEGKITSDVIYHAIASASGRISAEFDKIPITFGGAMQQMENAVLALVDGFNTSSGIVGALAQGVSVLSQHLGTLANALMHATAAWVAYKMITTAQNFLSVGEGVGFLAGNFARLTTAVRAATAAMLANPLGLIVASIAAVTFAFDEFISKQHFAFSELETTWGDVALGVWDDFKTKVGEVGKYLSDVWQDVSEEGGKYANSLLGDVVASFQGIVESAQEAINKLIGAFSGGYEAIKIIWSNFPTAMSGLGKAAINGLLSVVEWGINKLIELIKAPLEMLNSVSAQLGGGSLVDVSGWKVSFDGLKQIETETEKGVRQAIGNAFDKAFSTDYLGNWKNGTVDYLKTVGDRYYLANKKHHKDTLSQAGTPSLANAGGKGEWVNRAKDKIAQAREQWENYFNDLKRTNADAFTKIALNEERALAELAKHLKTGVVSFEEAEKAKALIAEQYLKERQTLAEKYAPHRTAERVYDEQKAEIEQLRQNGNLSDKEAGIANQQNEWQRFIDTADKSDPLNGIKQSFKAFGSEAENVMGNVAQITNAALGGMADQLTEFVMTGKADFRGLATSIIKDITNMIIKMMIFKAIEMGGKAMGFDMSFMKVGASGGGAFYTGGLVGFAQGGFTGLGGKYTPAGVVHKGEYVMTKEATSKLGVDYLDYLNYGMSRSSASLGNNGFAYGGGAGVPTLHNAASSPKPSIMVKIINNGQAVEAKVSQEQDGDQTKITVELMQQMQNIAKQEAQKVITENFRAGGSFAR